MVDRISTLDAATNADNILLNATSVPVMALKMKVADSLREELFSMSTMSDNLTVVETNFATQLGKKILKVAGIGHMHFNKHS